MCLSTVYQVRDAEEQLICQHVSAAVIEDGQVRFTDIMGGETVVEGVIEKIDLVNNTILVRAKS